MATRSYLPFAHRYTHSHTCALQVATRNGICCIMIPGGGNALIGGESPACIPPPHIYTYTSFTTVHLQRDTPPHFIGDHTPVLTRGISFPPDT